MLVSVLFSDPAAIPQALPFLSRNLPMRYA
jgi:hypothetical protein